MKTEAEVREAYNHLREAAKGSGSTPGPLGPLISMQIFFMMDMLTWVLGARSDFDEVIGGFRLVDSLGGEEVRLDAKQN